MSLRVISDALGVSIAYLSDVERGCRPPLPTKYWPKLVTTIPNLRLEELAKQASRTSPLKVDLTRLSPNCREVCLAIIRRIQERSLTDSDCKRLLDILSPP